MALVALLGTCVPRRRRSITVTMIEEKEGSGIENDQTQERSTTVDPQTSSLLFQRLPQELRDHIYRLLFSNTRFKYDYFGHPRRRTVAPAPNGLALLLVCRRARLEIGKSWLHYVLFWYGCGEAMLDKLSGLPADTLSQIRHIRVSGRHILVPNPLGLHSMYPLVCALKLLPGLRLDQLTVMDGIPGPRSYDTLNRLIVESDGWKTLRYICQGSEMLGFASRHAQSSIFTRSRYWRKPQPMHWQMIMERRDGAATNPSVAIYRAKEIVEDGFLGTLFDPSKRYKFKQKLWEDSDQGPGVFPRDPELINEQEWWKETLVIVKRGSGVDYEEKKDSPFAELDSDLRQEYPGETWHQMRAKPINGVECYDGDDGDMLQDDIQDSVHIIVDDYKDADEYLAFRYFLGNPQQLYDE